MFGKIVFFLFLIKIAVSLRLTSLWQREVLEDPIVELPTGKILGRQATTFASTSYFSFQKIPFAAPPVGSLRFKAPQPAQNWDGILDATTLDVSCYQLLGNSPFDSEDCLILNVYTPQLPDGTTNETLAVMLFIYGGAFVEGNTMYYPPDLFVDNSVILVTVNYRVGLLGFGSTEDEVIPGNNGLKDQRLAIQWTHDNIHLFGGDPDKITIFGESAGSASVAYQLLNQDSQGLFRAAILESGTFLATWTEQTNARSKIFGTAALLNSSFETSDDSQALLDFLQSVDADDLDAAAEQYMSTSTIWDNGGGQNCTWTPIIEVKNPDAFLTRKMYGLLQAGNFLTVPSIIGYNSEESLLFYPDPDTVQSILEEIDANLDLLVPDDMQITDPDQHSEMARSIRDIYTGGEPFGTHAAYAIKYFTDNGFTRSIIKHAQLASAVAETYFYQFSYDGQIGGNDVHIDGAEGVGHGEDIPYLFCSGTGCDFSGYPENDQITSKRLIKLWTDFAKYQNPTPEPSELLQNVTWPAVSTEDGTFLYLDINEDLVVSDHPRAESFDKWDQLYQSLGPVDFDTY